MSMRSGDGQRRNPDLDGALVTVRSDQGWEARRVSLTAVVVRTLRQYLKIRGPEGPPRMGSAAERELLMNVATTREAREGRTVLYPLRLDDAVLTTTQGWAQALRDGRHIGDFRQWTDYAAYHAVFGRLLRDLKAEQP